LNWRKKKDLDKNEHYHSEGTDDRNLPETPFNYTNNDKVINHFNEGFRLYNEGKYDAAITEFDEAIKKERRNESAHYYKAASLYKLGQPDRAVEAIKHAISLDEISLKEHNTRKENDRAEEVKEQLGKAYQLKGSILMELGRKSEAADCLSKVYEYCPRLVAENPEFDEKYVRGLVGAILSYLGVGVYRKEDPAPAAGNGGSSGDDRKDVVEEDGVTLDEYKKAYQHAKERLDEYIKIKPFDVDALFLKAQVILDSVELEKKVTREEDLNEAKLALNKAIGFDSTHAPAHGLLGFIYQYKSPNLPGLALDSFNKAIAMFEDRLSKIDSTSHGGQWTQFDNITNKIPSWKDWDYITLRIYLASTIMAKSVSLASDGKEREARENLEEAEKIHFDNFQRTSTTDDIHYVNVRLAYADNFLRKSLVDLSLAQINFLSRLNENVMIKLDEAEKQIDMGIRFIEDLQKDLTAGKIRYISTRQIVSIKTDKMNFIYLKEHIRRSRTGFRNGQNPSFIQ
jgi:tetratricopeptide (TPR) repeat protein